MLVDAHAHIDWYTDDLDEALRRIERHRILTVAVAMDVPSYRRTVEIARSSPLVIPAFGIHPWEAPHWADRLHELDRWLEETPQIGEAGLDFHYVKEEELYPAQIEVFEYLCAAAGRMAKPMNLHTRGADRRVLEMLRRHRPPPSLIHWYGGPLDLVESYLAEGCYFTIGIDLLNPAKRDDIARLLPLERILLETDNPDGCRWLTGENGMPDLLLTIAERLAAIQGMSMAELEERLWRNWREFIGDRAAHPEGAE